MPENDTLYVKNFSNEIINQDNINYFILKASSNETKRCVTQHLKLKFSKHLHL